MTGPSPCCRPPRCSRSPRCQRRPQEPPRPNPRRSGRRARRTRRRAGARPGSRPPDRSAADRRRAAPMASRCSAARRRPRRVSGCPVPSFRTRWPSRSSRSSRGPRRWSPSRELNELEPHTRCKPSGVARQFLTPYGVEFVELDELQRVYIFDIGGPHTWRTIYMDGRSHPAKPEADLLRSFDRLVGGRHAGRRHRRLQRVVLVGSRRLAAHRAAAHHREVHAHRFLDHTLRADYRRPRRLHGDVHRRDEPAVGGRHRAVRVPVPAGQLRRHADGRRRHGRRSYVGDRSLNFRSGAVSKQVCVACSAPSPYPPSR